MANRNLKDELNRLGFSLFEKEGTPDANKTLYDIVKSGDTRLAEGFPLVLANAAKNGEFDYNAVMAKCKSEKEKALFAGFFDLAAALYKLKGLSLDLMGYDGRRITEQERNRMGGFLKLLKTNENFKIGKYEVSPKRVKTIFDNYYSGTISETAARQEELSLEYAMSQIFSPKQKNLFRKRLKGEKMTKTEKEYYSRTVKKKVAALANPELHGLARRILER
ncbi:MAG: hypothetical protein PHW46_06085 [Candidatus Omnitrophica bacterium]|nr:hypothetical protein [Candidatus Omnitrophota bacterium]